MTRLNPSDPARLSASALLPNRLLRLNSSGRWAYCGAGENPDATCSETIDAAALPVTGHLINTGGTYRVRVAADCAVGALLYTAANGELTPASAGAARPVFKALQASVSGNREVEVAPIPPEAFVSETFTYNAPAAFSTIWTARRGYRVVGITARVDVVGSDGGAVTAVVRKTPSGTAYSGGTTLHTGTINLKGTVDTNQPLTLSTTSTDLDIASGDSIGLVPTGTTTAARGTVTLDLVAV